MNRTVFKSLHALKTSSSILVTEEGMFIEVREWQSQKAIYAILVTQDGISYFSKPTPARIRMFSFLLNNTLFSELYTGFDSSTIMEVRELQPSKASHSILITEEGMFMEGRELQPSKIPKSIFVTEEGMFMDLRELQPLKAFHPILVTEEGMCMEVRERQFWKAPPSIPETRYPLTYPCISTVELFLSARPTTTAFCSCSFTSYLTPLSTTSLAHEGRAHSIPTITKRQWRTSA